jgi:superfamily II DNA or RNA helicase
VKAKIEGKKLFFFDYSQEEIDKVGKLLSWEGDDYHPPETLLLKDNDQFYTFWGLYSLLSKKVKMELVNPPEDSAVEYPPISADFLQGITLYDYQAAAARKCLSVKRGIVSIPGAGGKTEIIIAIIQELLTSSRIDKALIVVPTFGLAEQFYERFMLRGFPSDSVGRIHGEIKEVDRPITIGVINSLVRGYRESPEIKKIVEESQAVMWDECHHCQAPTWLELAEGTRSEYTLCFSGTPFHADEEEDILDTSGDALTYGLAGKPIFEISLRYLVEKGIVARPFVFFKSLSGKLSKYPGRFTNIYKTHIVNNSTRNELIVKYAEHFQEINFPTLILVQRKEHAMNLLNMLKDQKAIFIYGGANAVSFDSNGMLDEYKIDYNTFRGNFEDGMYNILIATQVFDEAIDIPSIQALIMAGAGRSKIKQFQRFYRAGRKKKDHINHSYIVDFIDREHVWLFAQSKKRRQRYEDLEIEIINDEMEFNRLLHWHKRELKKNNEGEK